MKDNRSGLLIIEGVLIIILVLFSGFLAYQNQLLTRTVQELSKPTTEPSPSSSPTPSSSPSASPSPSLTPSPKNSPIIKVPTPVPTVN